MSRTKCLRPEELALLARGEVNAEARAHVDGCADCRRALARIGNAQLALREMAAEAPPDLGMARAEAAIRWSRPAPAPRSRPIWVWGLGLGLSATAALAFVLWPRHKPVEQAAVPAPIEQTPAPAVDAALSAWINLLQGEIELHRGSEARPLRASDRIGTGDALFSLKGARVAIQWSGGAGSLVEAETQLFVDRLSQTKAEFGLEKGKVSLREEGRALVLQVPAQKPAYRISGQKSWFVVGAAGEQVTIEVLEGSVEVADLVTGSTIKLQAPTRAVFAPGKQTSRTLAANEAAALRNDSPLNLHFTRADSGLIQIDAAESSVTLDGVRLGQTPIWVRRDKGRHLVQLNRDGYLPVQKWVTVGETPGELLALDLAPQFVPPAAPEPGEVEAIVQKRARQIRACYERSLKRNPALHGQVTMQIDVGIEGQVTAAKVETSTLDDEDAAQCLRAETRNWRFDHARKVTLVYPFVFRPE